MPLLEKKQTHTLESGVLQQVEFARIRGEIALPANGVNRILCVHGQVQADTAEVLADAVELSGTARFYVLYCDGQDLPDALTLQTTWQTRIDLPGATPSMTAWVDGQLQEAEASFAGSMLQLDAVAALTVTLTSQQAYTVLQDLQQPPGQPEVQTLRTTLPGQRIVAQGRAVRTLSGDALLPQRMPDADAVLFARGDIRVDECQVASGRAFIRGQVEAELVYRCTQGELYTTPLTLPFDAAIDLDNQDTPADPPQVRASCRQVEAYVEADAEGSRRVIRLAITAEFAAVCRQACSVELVQDAFVPGGQLQLQTQELFAAQPHLRLDTATTLSYTLTPPEGMPAVSRILAALHTPSGVQTTAQQGRATVFGAVGLSVLYQSVGQAGVYGFTQQVPFSLEVQHDQIMADMPMQAAVSVDECTVVPQAPYEVECRIPIHIRLTAYPAVAVQAVESAQLTPASAPAQGLCALVIAQPQDTPWSVCKRYGMALNTLQALNPGLEQSLVPGSRLVVYRPLS